MPAGRIKLSLISELNSESAKFAYLNIARIERFTITPIATAAFLAAFVFSAYMIFPHIHVVIVEIINRVVKDVF